MMTAQFSILVTTLSVLALLLTACEEPRRTPDGHLMDRPKVSAYGPDDITKHDTGTSEDESDKDEQ